MAPSVSLLAIPSIGRSGLRTTVLGTMVLGAIVFGAIVLWETVEWPMPE